MSRVDRFELTSTWRMRERISELFLENFSLDDKKCSIEAMSGYVELETHPILAHSKQLADECAKLYIDLTEKGNTKDALFYRDQALKHADEAFMLCRMIYITDEGENNEESSTRTTE